MIGPSPAESPPRYWDRRRNGICYRSSAPDLVGRLRLALGQQARGGANLSRRAVAALERIMIDKRLPAAHEARRQWPIPSIVVTFAPSFMTASVRHELTRRPSMSTVQAPHWP